MMMIMMFKRFWPSVPIGVILQPFEVFMAISCVLSGISALFVDARPASVQSLLPHWAVLLWGMNLLIGGVALAFGVFRQRTPLERLGLRLLANGSFIYALCAIIFAGIHGVIIAFILFAFTATCAARLHTISVTERLLRDGGFGR